MAFPKELEDIFLNPTIQKVQFLVRWLWPEVKACRGITHNQANIIKKIAFSEVKRLSISAYTRYGKSQVVAIAIAIYILINENKKIKFIGPTDDQAGIIKNYMAELLLKSRNDIFLNIAEFEAKGAQRIKAEASSKRMTFTNGCEYRVVSAYGRGFASMGHGADLIVMDESAMISRESYAKITRMLGDDPENSVLVELFNPWSRDTKAFDHSISDRFERICIDYTVGIAEGRTTEAFVQEQKEDISPIEFTVLYLSQFPEEAEDSLYTLKSIESSMRRVFHLDKEMRDLELKLKEPHRYTESEVRRWKQELKMFVKIVSCDPADKGLDETVIYWGIRKGNLYQLIGAYSEPKSESMVIVGRIMNKVRDFIGTSSKGAIHVDGGGLGIGPVSRIREILTKWGWKNVRVVSCMFGEGAIKKDHFVNKKAENYFRNQSILTEELISIPDNLPRLRRDMFAMRWDFTSSGKKKIIDPTKSPDWTDALIIFTWKDDQELAFAFG